jgi:hypothetical protein
MNNRLPNVSRSDPVMGTDSVQGCDRTQTCHIGGPRVFRYRNVLELHGKSPSLSLTDDFVGVITHLRICDYPDDRPVKPYTCQAESS